MSDNEKAKDPDNVWVSAGKKDITKVYVKTPFNYRSAQAAIKETDATWKGESWEVDKTAFEAAEAGIRAGAQEDIALGKDGRKEREETLKAEKAASKAAAKPELTEEEKAEKTAARAAAVAERDQTRVPVVVGSVAEGGTVSIGGNDVSVTGLGSTWELKDDAAVEALKVRFPDVELEVGASIQFASFEAPEPAEEPGM